MKKTFAELFINDEIEFEKIDDFVDEWHEGDSELPIHEYLGLSEQEYAMWVETTDGFLRGYLEDKKEKRI